MLRNGQALKPLAHRALLTCLVVMLSTAFMLAFTRAAQAAPKIDKVERAQLRVINRYRKENGLKPVRLDKRLSKVAHWMGRDMVANDYFSHVDQLGRDPFARLLDFKYPDDTWRGENLAAGSEDAEGAFTQWRESEAHNRNMLNGNYRAIGIARVYDPSSEYGWYWVTEFGSRVVAPYK